MTPEGVKRTRTVKRLPEDSRWDAGFVASCRGTPWDHEGIEEFEDMRGDLDIPERAHEAAVPAAEVRPPVLRMRINHADVHTHGPTHKCPGCRAVALKLRSQSHTENCRERMMRLIGESPMGAARVQDAEDRINEELARRLEEDSVNIDEEEMSKPKKKARKSEDDSCAAAATREEGDREGATAPSQQSSASHERPSVEDDGGGKKQRINLLKAGSQRGGVMQFTKAEYDKSEDAIWKTLADQEPVLVMGGIGARGCNPKEAQKFLDFCREVYEYQMSRDQYFLHCDEYRMRSFSSKDFRSLACEPNVRYVQGKVTCRSARVMSKTGPKNINCVIEGLTNVPEMENLMAKEEAFNGEYVDLNLCRDGRTLRTLEV